MTATFEQPPSTADMARCAFGFGDDGAPLPGGFRVHPELAAAGLWTTPYDLALMVIGIVQSRAGRPDASLAQALAKAMGVTPPADVLALADEVIE